MGKVTSENAAEMRRLSSFRVYGSELGRSGLSVYERVIEWALTIEDQSGRDALVDGYAKNVASLTAHGRIFRIINGLEVPENPGTLGPDAGTLVEKFASMVSDSLKSSIQQQVAERSRAGNV